ncbi:hypothetical protein HZA33_03565 [Candidatus Pacearchaeota archaeon]|nr:hypothetical protein [Candidatus Pacearchaeota archaeon]
MKKQDELRLPRYLEIISTQIPYSGEEIVIIPDFKGYRVTEIKRSEDPRVYISMEGCNVAFQLPLSELKKLNKEGLGRREYFSELERLIGEAERLLEKNSGEN